jgi:hypothetical protein
MEAFLMKIVQMAGFKTIVVGSRQFGFLRYDWLVGNEAPLELSDFEARCDIEWVNYQLDCLDTLQDWLNLEYDGAHVGRFTIASTMRSLSVGQLDFSNPSIKAYLKKKLEESVRYTIAAKRLLREIKPDCMLFMDRGYSGQGELFDLGIKDGIDTITWNLGHKSNLLVVKRYHSGNMKEHPLTPSAATWEKICSIKWKPEYGGRVREELFSCYKKQDWFSIVGTQFNKNILSAQKTRQKLGLSGSMKVAVIFSHIFWDGSFFWGDDLFENYTQWFIETIRAAIGNSHLQWIIKLHPAHLVKAKQRNDTSRPMEIDTIEATFGKLPDHVKIVYPDDELSTYSLFQIADYAVTVRGTVGIESALFGIPVITAGTGRYDRRGFTIDSATREEYLQKLATLQTYPRLSIAQIELAERYAYAVFICRPLGLSSVSFEYERDGIATPKVTIHCRTREQWLAAADISHLASWISRRESEDLPMLEASFM